MRCRAWVLRVFLWVKEMISLVTVNNGVASTTSLIIAEQFGRKHSHVLKSIEKVISTGYEIVPSAYIDESGKSNKFYELTERDAYIVMPFIGGQKSVAGQIALVDAFLALRTTVNNLLVHYEQLDIAAQFSMAFKKTNKIKPVKEREDLYNYLDGREWDALYAIEFGGNTGVSENFLIDHNAGYQQMSTKIRNRFENILVKKGHIVVIFISNNDGIEEKTFFIR